jgi:hypothetical protein
MVGGEQLEPCAGGLCYQQAVERVVPGELGEIAECLGVLGGDAEQYQSLGRELIAEVQVLAAFWSAAVLRARRGIPAAGS